MITLPERYTVSSSSRRSGGFGATYVCVDENLEREVIIKEIIRPEDLSRLVDEIKALQRAKSKNVVQIYDVITSDDGREIAIVEEYIPGADLIRYRVSEEDNINDFYMVLYQLANGLKDIHDCDIVHRDFKPNNVKVDAEEIIKIFDFGLAKYELPASTVGLVGTLGFMAPELFDSPPLIDKPVDIYAFGVSVFCFAKGSPPDGALTRPIPSSIKESILDYVSIDPNIGELINRCLSVDSSDRPSMAEISNALKKILVWGKHKGTLTSNTKIYFLEEVDKGLRVTRSDDMVVIVYNGYDFVLDQVEGDVYVNNNPVSEGFTLAGSAVITLGREELRGRRRFVTFDVSHPEVLI
jgi:serine/threonine-protein kinase